MNWLTYPGLAMNLDFHSPGGVRRAPYGLENETDLVGGR